MTKWILIVLGVLVAIPAAAFLIGLALPRTHSISVSKTFEVPAGALFGIAVDIDLWHTWRSDVDRVNHLEGDGFRAEVVSGRDVLTYRFDGDFEQRLMVTTILTEGLPFGGEWRIQVESDSEGTSRITVTENGFVDPPIWRFASKFIFGHETTAQRYLDDLTSFCESGGCEAGEG